MAPNVSKPAAAMLAAATIPVPLLLIGANQAAGSTHARSANRAHHSKLAPHKAAHHLKAADGINGAHRIKAAHRLKSARRLKSAHQINAAHHIKASHHAKTSAPARHANTTAAALHAKTAAGRSRTGRGHAARTAKSRSWRLVLPGARKAQAANDPADTISDFKFTPGSLTIHVGDTVTWTNNGPTDHTATANDGSFNTGTLKKGQSASHTFTKAGTFAYICAIHPFMKGTIVVEASTSSTTAPSTTPTSRGGSGSGSGSSTTGTGSAATTSTGPATTASGPTLPVTGLDLTSSVLLGLALLGAGLGLRRRVS